MLLLVATRKSIGNDAENNLVCALRCSQCSFVVVVEVVFIVPKYMTVTSCYNFTFITTLSDVHQNVYAGDEKEEYRDDAVNNTDDNLVRAHQLEHC